MEEARCLEVANYELGAHLRGIGAVEHHMLHPHECSKHTPSPPAYCRTPAAPTTKLTGELNKEGRWPGTHKKSGTRAGNHRRHTRISNASSTAGMSRESAASALPCTLEGSQGRRHADWPCEHTKAPQTNSSPTTYLVVHCCCTTELPPFFCFCMPVTFSSGLATAPACQLLNTAYLFRTLAHRFLSATCELAALYIAALGYLKVR